MTLELSDREKELVAKIVQLSVAVEILRLKVRDLEQSSLPRVQAEGLLVMHPYVSHPCLGSVVDGNVYNIVAGETPPCVVHRYAKLVRDLDNLVAGASGLNTGLLSAVFKSKSNS